MSLGSVATVMLDESVELELLRRPRVERDLLFTPAQREVIEAKSSSRSFVSGPAGSGKSEVLIARALHLLRSGIKPDRLLILTFGRDHADLLRDEIATRGKTVAREPLARTFSALAFSIVRLSMEKSLRDPILLSGAEQDDLIRDLLATDLLENISGWPETIKPALGTRGFAKELRDLISRAKEWGLEPEDLSQLAQESKDELWTPASRLWQRYESVNLSRDSNVEHAKDRIDPSELINRAVRVMKASPEFRDRVRELFDVVLIDQFEESDPSHRRLLEAFSPQAFTIFYDQESTVSRFRGADPEGLAPFLERFESGYGMEAGVSRHFLAERIRERPRRLFIESESLSAEAHAIAEHLRSLHHRREIPWSEMAVIVRSPGEHLTAIRRALIHIGIPVNQESGTLSLAENPVIRPLLLVAEIAIALARDGKVEATPKKIEEMEELLLSEFGGLDALELRRIRSEINRIREEGDLTPTREILLNSLAQGEAILDFDQSGALASLRKTIASARSVASNPSSSITDLLWAIWSSAKDREGNLVSEKWRNRAIFSPSTYDSGSADRDLDAVVELFEMAKRHAQRFPLAAPSLFIEGIRKAHVVGDVIVAKGDRGEEVTLTTVHSAKGSEWRVVVIAGLQEGKWPNLRLRGSLLGSERLVDIGRHGLLPRAELNALSATAIAEDEARIFEVAKDRASELIIFTAVSREDDEPSSFFARERDLTEADHEEEVRPFLIATAKIALLRRELIDPSTTPTRKSEIASLLKTLADGGFVSADPENWLGVRKRSSEDPIVAHGDDVFISPSEIDRFLECELRWFLEKSGAREGDSQAALLGSTLHVYAKLIADGEVDLSEAKSRLERAWHLIDLNSGWVQKAGLNDALRTLTRFFEWHHGNPRSIIATEASFTLEIGRIKVRGSADRIEIDGEGVHYIVDLKTSHEAMKATEADANQQLATYQAALTRGAFEGIDEGVNVGGAELVYPATDAKSVTTRSQGVKDSQETIRTLSDLGERMSGARFVATINANCRVCVVRSLCPMQGEGRSMVQ